MITAAAITDEQIRELRDWAVSFGMDDVESWCDLALRATDRNARQVYGERYIENTRKARARCASIINGRDAPDIFADLNARTAVTARRCNKCGALCDHEGWNGIDCPWCARAASKAGAK